MKRVIKDIIIIAENIGMEFKIAWIKKDMNNVKGMLIKIIFVYNASFSYFSTLSSVGFIKVIV